MTFRRQSFPDLTVSCAWYKASKWGASAVCAGSIVVSNFVRAINCLFGKLGLWFRFVCFPPLWPLASASIPFVWSPSSLHCWSINFCLAYRDLDFGCLRMNYYCELFFLVHLVASRSQILISVTYLGNIFCVVKHSRPWLASQKCNPIKSRATFFDWLTLFFSWFRMKRLSTFCNPSTMVSLFWKFHVIVWDLKIRFCYWQFWSC